MSNHAYRRKANLLEAEVGDDLVALDAEAGKCFGFNAIATSVWRTLSRPRTFDELRAQLLEEYAVDPQQCEEDLRELLLDLRHKGLIEQD